MNSPGLSKDKFVEFVTERFDATGSFHSELRGSAERPRTVPNRAQMVPSGKQTVCY